MANLVYRFPDCKMTQKKSTYRKSNQDQTILDRFLWVVENYLPQKKKRSSNDKFLLVNLESITNKKINKLVIAFYKVLRGDLRNTKIIFTVGKWAAPYLYSLKRIKIIKQILIYNFDSRNLKKTLNELNNS